MTDLDTLLACPRCAGPLEALECRSCNLTFPAIGGIPCLFVEPGYAIADWRNRWRLERQNLNREAMRARQAATETSGRTKARLQQLAAGFEQQQEAVEAIIAPMLGADSGAARETLLALRTRLPSHHAPITYASNVVRDWVWGQVETDAALNVLLPLLPEGGPLLQLGSGAGRLSFELGRSRPVIALDMNPLLALLAQRLCQGESFRFVEFPIAPRRSDDACVTHRMSPPTGSSTVRWLLGDALQPPLKRHGFSMILTHWLVDIIDQPFTALASTINSLLEAGGVWVNQGSLAFANAEPAQNLLLDEVAESLDTTGFTVETMREDELPYLHSPYSRQRRNELVVTWKVRKVRDVGAPKPVQRLPDWLAGNKAPIPLLPAFATQAATVRIHAWIMSLVDGQRSLSTIAEELERQGLMPRKDAETAVRGFLITMYEEFRRSG